MSEDRNDDVTARSGRAGPRPDRRPPARGGRRGRATRPLDPERPCLNCGDPTPGEFCPSCGQRKVDVQVSLRALFMEVLEDQFIIDRRLPRTLAALLFRPGLLTVEHVNGRIVRYIHPFRLYLVSSLLFFLLLSFFSLQLVRRALDEGKGPAAITRSTASGLDEALAELRLELADTTLTEEEVTALQATRADLLERRRQLRLDSLSTRIAELGTAVVEIERTIADTTLPETARSAVRATRPMVEGQMEVAIAQRAALLADTAVADTTVAGAAAGRGGTTGGDDRPLREVFGWDDNPPSIRLGVHPAMDSAVAGQVRRIGDMTGPEAVETLVGTFLGYVPTMMFILLPVFAGCLKLLYIRRRRYYAEHFVFLLHVHSFVFILAITMLLLRGRTFAWVEATLGAWILLYIYLAMKRVYGQGWLKTLLKYWTLGWMYFWVLAGSIPVAFLATILFF